MTDIEQALAEALHVIGEEWFDECTHREDQGDLDAGLPLVRVYRDCAPANHAAKTAAILATPSMQAIARQAAIGAAVERLESCGLDWKIVRDREYEPQWYVCLYSESIDAPDAEGDATTLHAAIAAALGDDDE